MAQTQRHDTANLTGAESADDLIEIIEQLSLECDSRHAHEDALASQVISLGGVPVEHTWLDPAPQPILREHDDKKQEDEQGKEPSQC